MGRKRLDILDILPRFLGALALDTTGMLIHVGAPSTVLPHHVAARVDVQARPDAVVESGLLLGVLKYLLITHRILT